MHTRTHPHDYNRRIAIIPTKRDYCRACGGFMFLTPSSDMTERACVDCGGTVTISIMEYEVDNYRKQCALAVELAAVNEDWRDDVKLSMNAVSYLSGDEIGGQS